MRLNGFAPMQQTKNRPNQVGFLQFIAGRKGKHMKDKREVVMKEQQEIRGRMGGTLLILSSAAAFIILGLLLLFVPQVQVAYICYFLCAVLIIWGIVLIARYFVTEAYRKIGEYGFSKGVLLVILGMCALVRTDVFVEFFVPALGICLLLSGITKLQYAVDLKSMRDGIWVVMLMISLVVMGGSIAVILDFFPDAELRSLFAYYLLIVDGTIGLAANLYLYIKIGLFQKDERQKLEAEESVKQEIAEPEKQTGSVKPDSGIEDFKAASESDPEAASGNHQIQQEQEK